VSGQRQASSTIIGWPASFSLPDTKTLVFGATIHFVRHSKICQRPIYHLKQQIGFYSKVATALAGRGRSKGLRWLKGSGRNKNSNNKSNRLIEAILAGGKTAVDKLSKNGGVQASSNSIISITVVVLVIIIIYFRDRQQQNVFELRRLEKRVEMLEEWGIPRQEHFR
jgi:hypothetical protein